MSNAAVPTENIQVIGQETGSPHPNYGAGTRPTTMRISEDGAVSSSFKEDLRRSTAPYVMDFTKYCAGNL